MITATLDLPKKVKVETSSCTIARSMVAGGSSRVTPINKAKPWMMALPRAFAHKIVTPGASDSPSWPLRDVRIGFGFLWVPAAGEQHGWSLPAIQSMLRALIPCPNWNPGKRCCIPGISYPLDVLPPCGLAKPPASAKAKTTLRMAKSGPPQPLASHHWM